MSHAKSLNMFYSNKHALVAVEFLAILKALNISLHRSAASRLRGLKYPRVTNVTRATCEIFETRLIQSRLRKSIHNVCLRVIAFLMLFE